MRENDAMRELWNNITSDPLTLTDLRRDMIDTQFMYEYDDFTVDHIERLGGWLERRKETEE